MTDCVEWLTYFLSRNEEDAARSTDYGMRALLCACMSIKPWVHEKIMNLEPFKIDEDINYLENLVNTLSIHIAILKSDGTYIIKETDSKNDAPLVVLHMD